MVGTVSALSNKNSKNAKIVTESTSGNSSPKYTQKQANALSALSCDFTVDGR
jgi:hypothetical protein